MTTSTNSHRKILSILYISITLEGLVFWGFRSIFFLFMIKTVDEGGLGIDEDTALEYLSLLVSLRIIMPVIGAMLLAFILAKPKGMILGGLLASSGIFIFSLGFDIPIPLVLILITLGLGLFEISTYSLLATTYSRTSQKHSAVFILMFFFISLSAFLGPITLGLVAGIIGLNIGLMIASGAMLLVVLLVYTFRDALTKSEEKFDYDEEPKSRFLLISFVMLISAVIGLNLDLISNVISTYLPNDIIASDSTYDLFMLLRNLIPAIIEFFAALLLGILWFKYGFSDWIKVFAGSLMFVLASYMLFTTSGESQPSIEYLLTANTLAFLGDLLIYSALYALVVQYSPRRILATSIAVIGIVSYADRLVDMQYLQSQNNSLLYFSVIALILSIFSFIIYRNKQAIQTQNP